MAEPLGTELANSDNDVAAALLELLRQLLNEIHPRLAASLAVSLDSNLTSDLGLDSLSRVELISRIEAQFVINLDASVFTDAETPRDLLAAVLEASPQQLASLGPEKQTVDLEETEATPQDARTLLEVLHWHVAHHPDRTHIRFYQDDGQGESLSYRQLLEGAEAVAGGLQQKDIQLGDRIIMMLPTGRDYFFCFFGILLAGGVPVPIYPPVRRSQIEDHMRRHAYILSNCLATILVTVPEGKTVSQLLKSQVETLQDIVTVEDLASGPRAIVRPSVNEDDIAFLQYTSGSTGNPKGVVLTHANLLANIRAMGAAVQADSTDVFVSWLPLYHDMGLIGAWLGSLYFGALLVVMSPLDFLSRPQRWLWAIHRHRATLSAAPNFAYELCLHKLNEQDLEGLDLGSWRAAFNGAEAVNADTLLAFYERLKGYGLHYESLMPVYGLAECSVGLAFPPIGRGPLIDRIERDAFMNDGKAVPAEAADQSALRFVVSGRPIAKHQVRIVDDHGHELPERRQGRLQFRGPSTTSGYFRNPGKSKELFDGEWLESGDLAYMAGGEVYITGRIKDVIIRAGRNIYPDELEKAVGEIEGVRKGRVAAFACKAADSGSERLVVMAETREQDADRQLAIRKRINATVTEIIEASPDTIVLAPPGTVLKTSSGKIRRAASREVYERGEMGKTQAPFWWQIVRLLRAGLIPELRRAKQHLATGLFGIYGRLVFFCIAPFVWLGVVLLPIMNWRWACMRNGALLLAKLTRTPFSVTGLDNLPAREQACVYVINHGSYLDGPVMVAALNRPVSFVAKNELTRHFVPRWFLQGIDTQFVERFDLQKGLSDARYIARVLGRGRSLAFFPEGTFTRMAGLRPFHMGAFVAAAEMQVPVVPIAIHGTRSILRGKIWFPHHGAITVSIGAPVYPEEIKVQTDGRTWSIALKLRDLSRAYILKHCGEPDLEYERPEI